MNRTSPRLPRKLKQPIGAPLWRLLAVVLVGAFLGTSALAQDPGVSYKRKTVINFDDDTIEGDLKTPDGQYLESSKKIRHKTLIRIRVDFRREVLGSISDL